MAEEGAIGAANPHHDPVSGVQKKRQRLILVLTAIFVTGALYATVVAFFWFAADFIAASIYSPNLNQAQQVADFNDFAHISSALASYRFPLGVLTLTMSVALLVLAVVINDPRRRGFPVYIAGGIALICLAMLLAQGFNWVFASLFVATVVALFLATNWPTPSTAEEAGAEAPSATEEAVELRGTERDEEPAMDTDVDASTAEEGGAAAGSEHEHDETSFANEAEAEIAHAPLIANDIDNAPDDAHAMDSLGIEIESDICLDLEQDYELAHDADTVEDPLVLLSQADLGIEEDDAPLADDTIETAAKIEAEVGIDVPLEEADTAQIRAMIDAVSTDEAPGTPAAPETPEVAVVDRQTAGTDNPERAAASAVSPAAVEFDPQELARQESLLPPPRTRVWNLLDWVIVVIILVAVLALIAINMDGGG